VVEPIPIEQPQPQVPEACLKSSVQGIFIIEAVIDESGGVGEVRTLRRPIFTPPCPALEETALAAVAKWRYKPATLKGKPVAVYLTVTIRLCPH
jgi:periplasmic protein TonB